MPDIVINDEYSSLFQCIVEFADFLNSNDYQISSDKIVRFMKMFNDDNLRITDTSDVLCAMRICFCTSFSQYSTLEEYFKFFFKSKHNDEQIQTLKKQQKALKSQGADRIAEIRARLNEIDENIKKVRAQVMAEQAKSYKITSEQKTTLKKLMQRENALNKTLIENVISESWDVFCEICQSEEEIKEEMTKVMNLCEEFLMKSNVARFKEARCYYTILENVKSIFYDSSKAKKASSSAAKTIEKCVKQRCAAEHEEARKLRDEEQEIINRRRKIQVELDKAIQESLNEPEEIEKISSKQHREQFVGGNNNVRNIGINDNLPEVFDKEFNDLSEKDKSLILQYIKDNILKFKTRISRNISCTDRHNIDMQETIARACRTGGLPINISYTRPHANKANIVLALDVSGSCSNASEMMLAFMHTLQTVFPRGCKAFAFVNTLYDVSNIMSVKELNKAMSGVLSAMNRRGEYSNYFIPLQTLWKDYRHVINSDSIVIFIGDARNNKNDTGEEYLKNISRKAKNCYWINTEPHYKWNVNDSLASTYGKYAKMYEATTTRQLLNFISSM